MNGITKQRVHQILDQARREAPLVQTRDLHRPCVWCAAPLCGTCGECTGGGCARDCGCAVAAPKEST
jgi:hypothetical protein